MPTSLPEHRTQVAYHEAGHAVTALVLGRSVKRLTVIPEPGKHEGVVVYEQVDPPGCDPAEWLTVDLAGGAALERLLGDTAAGWLDGVGLAGRASAGDLAQADARAIRLCHGSRGRARELLERRLGVARSVVAHQWAAVVCVAEALLELEEMDGAQLRACYNACLENGAE